VANRYNDYRMKHVELVSDEIEQFENTNVEVRKDQGSQKPLIEGHTMAKGKRRKKTKKPCKTINRNLKIEQHESHKNRGELRSSGMLNVK